MRLLVTTMVRFSGFLWPNLTDKIVPKLATLLSVVGSFPPHIPQHHCGCPKLCFILHFLPLQELPASHRKGCNARRGCGICVLPRSPAKGFKSVRGNISGHMIYITEIEGCAHCTQTHNTCHVCS